MRFIIRPFMLGALLGAAAATTLPAQEVWDSSFKLCAGSMSGAKEARLGSSFNWALAMDGSYQLFPKGSIAFDLGYRTMGTATTGISTTVSEEDSSKGFFGSVMYRHTGFHGFLEGLYVNGGLRYNTLKTTRDNIVLGGGSDGTDQHTETRGQESHNISPLLGAGFRFTSKISLELNAFRVTGRNLDDQDKSSTVLEVALGIHL